MIQDLLLDFQSSKAFFICTNLCTPSQIVAHQVVFARSGNKWKFPPFNSTAHSQFLVLIGFVLFDLSIIFRKCVTQFLQIFCSLYLRYFLVDKFLLSKISPKLWPAHAPMFNYRCFIFFESHKWSCHWKNLGHPSRLGYRALIAKV